MDRRRTTGARPSSPGRSRPGRSIPTTGQYYLHSFLREQPDLNWWNPDVREAFDGILRFWLDRGVDGFRIDVAHRMARDPDLRDNPERGLPPGEHLKSWTDEDAPRDEDWPEVHEILRRFRRTLDAYDARMAIGEVFILDPNRLVRYYGEHDDELHMAFNFSFLRAPWSASALRDEVELLERLVPPSAWPDHTLSNHDNPRTVSRYAPAGDLAVGRRRARLAALMLLTLRGTPFLYYGEEIGMADTPIPPERVLDVAGRDPERTPMPWDGSRGGGFTTGEPWLPMGAETGEVNVEAQGADPSSMLAFYRDVIRLRRSTPALRSGSYATVEGMPADVFALRPRGCRRAMVCGAQLRPVIGRGRAAGRGDDEDLRPIPLGRSVSSPGSGIVLGPEEGIVTELDAPHMSTV